MMNSLIVLTLVASQQAAPSGKPEEPKIRYDIAPLVRLYQQAHPKVALESTIKALEKGRYDYVAAHLLDPAYVDAAAIERGKASVNDVADAFSRRRAQEKENLSGTPRDLRVPDEPEKLKVLIDAETQSIGFRKLTDDLRQLAADDPGQLKDLRRFLKDGIVAETGDTAKITLADTKDRAVFLIKKDGRWYVENRQMETKPVDKPMDAAKEPAPMNP
jgi:hypothetical protein